MGEVPLSKELEDAGFEAGQKVLHEAVIEAGGFEGVFRELRENWGIAANKYELLLLTSTTPDQKKANEGAFRDEQGNDTLVETIMSLASKNDIPPEDAPAFFLAAVVTRKAGLMEEK